MDLDQVEAFLVLAEELHFGRTAGRLHVSAPRVSRLIAALEREVGAAVFERTSRQVRLTPLGHQFRADLAPAHAGLLAAVAAAKASARDVTGVLRVGFSQSTASEAVIRLLARFTHAHPDCELVRTETPIADPYRPLRTHEVDLLINWHYDRDEPGLTFGPVIESQARVLAVARSDPLADRATVSIEDLAGRAVLDAEGMTAGFWREVIPATTPSGRPIPRRVPIGSLTMALAQVAAGTIVHPTTVGVQRRFGRDDIVWIPIHDMPPLDLGLIWLTPNTTARIVALAALAGSDRD